MFGPLFLTALQFRFVGLVLTRRRAPGPGPSYGMGGGPAGVDGDHGLDGRAHDLEVVQVQVIHIRGRIDAAQRPVDLERMGLGPTGKPLRIGYLNHVASIDVIDTSFDHLGVPVLRLIRLNL